jgi:hypothetical protein
VLCCWKTDSLTVLAEVSIGLSVSGVELSANAQERRHAALHCIRLGTDEG